MLGLKVYTTTPCLFPSFLWQQSLLHIQALQEDVTPDPVRPYTHTISPFSGTLPTILETVVSGGMCLGEWELLGILVCQLMARATGLSSTQYVSVWPKNLLSAHLEVGTLHDRGLWRTENIQPCLCAPTTPVLRLGEENGGATHNCLFPGCSLPTSVL